MMNTNKTDRHDIIEILLKVALNNITLALTKTLFIKLYVRVASYMENIDMTASYYSQFYWYVVNKKPRAC
jgi:hypothetical protein